MYRRKLRTGGAQNSVVARPAPVTRIRKSFPLLARSLGTWLQFCQAVQKSASRKLPLISSNPVSGKLLVCRRSGNGSLIRILDGRLPRPLLMDIPASPVENQTIIYLKADSSSEWAAHTATESSLLHPCLSQPPSRPKCSWPSPMPH
jgi:hypothetical protein